MMTNLKKINEVFGLIVSIASSVVTLSEIWNKIKPDVKKALQPVLDGCKSIATNSNSEEEKPTNIENKKIQ